MSDFQVRIEYDDDGAEDVHNFDTREAAEQAFHEKCTELRENTESGEDAHVELIEVLLQEHVIPAFEEGNR